MSEEVNKHEVHPAKLPAAKYEEVKARAQRILDLRGKPPYRASTFVNVARELGGTDVVLLSDDEALILSEFVTYWMPYLVEKVKPAEEWITWNGEGDPAVQTSTPVKVRFRNDYISSIHPASYWIWRHSGECDDIVAYMVME